MILRACSHTFLQNFVREYLQDYLVYMVHSRRVQIHVYSYIPDITRNEGDNNEKDSISIHWNNSAGADFM